MISVIQVVFGKRTLKMYLFLFSMESRFRCGRYIRRLRYKGLEPLEGQQSNLSLCRGRGAVHKQVLEWFQSACAVPMPDDRSHQYPACRMRQKKSVSREGTVGLSFRYVAVLNQTDPFGDAPHER